MDKNLNKHARKLLDLRRK